MPRLTNAEYLVQRQALRKLWRFDEGGAFAVLPGHAQRDLHDFYAPTVSMTDENAITHRARMTKAFPSFPQSACRAFEGLRANLVGQPNQIVNRYLERTTSAIKAGRKTRQLRVLAVSRPEGDIDALARVLVQLSKEDFDGKLLKMARKIG